MYYSSKVVVDLQPPVTTHSFQPYGKPLGQDASSEQVASQRKLEEQIKFLGVVNDVYYHYVPDELELVEQPEQAEVTKLGILPSEVEVELALNGEYVKQARYKAALQNAIYVQDAYDERKQVAMWQAITDISDVMAQMLEQSAMIIPDNGNVNTSLETIKRLRKQSNAVKEELSKVGL